MSKQPNFIIERAVDLWCRKLHNPVFDNGDNTEHGFMSQAMASMVIQADKGKVDNLESSIEIFRHELTAELKRLRDADEYFPRWLDVDYGPCKELQKAGDAAGIPNSLFSCKSSVSMMDDYVRVSFGYGAEGLNHYRLPNGGWLITTLYGSDMDKVIMSVENGNPLNLTTEGVQDGQNDKKDST